MTLRTGSRPWRSSPPLSISFCIHTFPILASASQSLQRDVEVLSPA